MMTFVVVMSMCLCVGSCVGVAGSVVGVVMICVDGIVVVVAVDGAVVVVCVGSVVVVGVVISYVIVMHGGGVIWGIPRGCVGAGVAVACVAWCCVFVGDWGRCCC